MAFFLRAVEIQERGLSERLTVRILFLEGDSIDRKSSRLDKLVCSHNSMSYRCHEEKHDLCILVQKYPQTTVKWSKAKCSAVSEFKGTGPFKFTSRITGRMQKTSTKNGCLLCVCVCVGGADGWGQEWGRQTSPCVPFYIVLTLEPCVWLIIQN